MRSNFNQALLRDLESGLRQLGARSQRRSLVEVRGVNLCSNDYLGLAQNGAFHEAVEEAVREAVRVGGTGSRLLSGHAAIWDELEEEFARFAGTEAALYFGSGYAANLGLLTSIVAKDDVVFSDELNHASLIDGIRLSGARKVVYPHLHLDALASELAKYRATPGRNWIVSETVFSMDGDIVPLHDLMDLAAKHNAGVILDEAHATAVHGPLGRGIAAQAGVLKGVVAVVHTCGKALASAGAIICGSAVLKEYLINNARTFIFTTAMPPYIAGQIRAALRLSLGMDAQRSALLSQSRGLIADLQEQGWDTATSNSQIVPIIIGRNDDALAAAEFLQREGFAVRAIRPPTVAEGRARLRLSLTASIATSELARLKDCLVAWRESVPSQHAAVGRA
jgi:8-amino-7-oxononanoate synthase